MATLSLGETRRRSSGTNATTTAGRSLKDEAAIRRVPSAPVERSWKVIERPVRTSLTRQVCFGALAERVVHQTDTAVRGSTLKGNKAQESIGLVAAATQRTATDSDTEKGLEVEGWAAS